jgi:hypothetical protein
MYKLLTTAVLGLAATALTLATPAESQAQSRFGISVDFGRGGFSYHRGYDYYNYPRYGYDYGYRSRPYYRDYDWDYGYGRSYDYGYRRDYGRGVIVHPESYHWTPGRGWHSHGHIHVPHRGHYHTRPY